MPEQPEQANLWKHRMITRFLKTIALAVTLFICNLSFGENKIVFNRDIRPILSNKCFACHGPNARDLEADLRLDTPGGKYGALTPRDDYQIIKPGSLEESELWYRADIYAAWQIYRDCQ